MAAVLAPVIDRSVGPTAHGSPEEPAERVEAEALGAGTQPRGEGAGAFC